MELVRFDDADPYGPPGHDGVVNRLLAGRGAGGVEQVSIWHGRFEPGGHSDTHVHEGSAQIYVGMHGSFRVSGPGTELTLQPSDAVVIPAGEAHAIHNDTDAPAEVLVISAPALR